MSMRIKFVTTGTEVASSNVVDRLYQPVLL